MKYIWYFLYKYVAYNMLVPLLVWCNFDLFKCCCFMFFLWSIKLMFLFVHISFRWLFTIWALYWCLSFLLMILEIKTSQVGDFADMARSTIDLTTSPASLSDTMSLVLSWKIIWYGLSRIIGLKPYLCTVRWPYVDIAVSSLTTNYISIYVSQ